jgi:beta-lactam-binding protein with PASTA domain
MRRIFNILFGALAMCAVAIVSAFISMRLAIHGREVTVPNLAGMTVPDAAAATAKLGLNLSMQNRFYSTAVPAGRILTQSPAPGSVVRRDSQLRVAESLGGQHVTIPNVIGQPERAASLVLRRLTLELGSVAHIPTPAMPTASQTNLLVGDTAEGAGGVIVAQSPSPNSAGAASPRVSFLLADPEPPVPPDAFVMPSLIGMNLAKATTLLASAGLHIASAQDPTAPAPASTETPAAAPAAAASSAASNLPAVSLEAPTQAPTTHAASWNAVIVSQAPLAGHRVLKSDPIRVTAVAHSSSASQ